MCTCVRVYVCLNSLDGTVKASYNVYLERYHKYAYYWKRTAEQVRLSMILLRYFEFRYRHPAVWQSFDGCAQDVHILVGSICRYSEFDVFICQFGRA